MAHCADVSCWVCERFETVAVCGSQFVGATPREIAASYDLRTCFRAGGAPTAADCMAHRHSSTRLNAAAQAR